MKNKRRGDILFYFCCGVIIILIIIFIFSIFTKKDDTGKLDNSENVVESIKHPFDAQATINVQGITLTADVNKTDYQKCTIVVNEPKSLGGMRFQYDGNKMNVTYKGMSVDINDKVAGSVAKILVDTIDTVSPELDLVLEDGLLVVSSENEMGEFNITLDEENGNIVSINVPNLDFECNFDDFIFKDNA